METIDSRYRQAECFAAVAECASFTRAGERLGCSKAHVSRQVVALEAALGVQLLLRSTRRVVLTDAGQVYLDYCRQLRETLRDGERAVAAAQQSAHGRLRLSAPTSMGEGPVLDLLLAFQARHPAIEIELDLSIGHRDLIAEGFDFALRSTAEPDPRLIARGLGVIDNLLVASPELLARLAPIRRPADLASVPCLCNPHLRDEPDWTFPRPAGLQPVRVHGPLQANHFGLLHQAALRGVGIARLPRFLLTRTLAEGRLQHVLPDHALAPTPLYLVFPQQRHRPLRQRLFRDFVVEWAALQDWISAAT